MITSSSSEISASTLTHDQDNSNRRRSIIELISTSPKRQSSLETDLSIPSLQLSIQFSTSPALIIRPNRIIRGIVKLKVNKPILASRIRVKFRAEEIAKAKIREVGLETKIERIDKMCTTFFEVDTMIWGTELSGFSLSPWEEIGIGEYEYPFALKFPNVNYPPSVDDLVGFSINYIFSAHVDGPSENFRSKDFLLPYRPIICAPPEKEWSYHQTVYPGDSKRLPIADIFATLPRCSFCPDEDIKVHLQINTISHDLDIQCISYSFIKYTVGQLQLQRGMARKETQKTILSESFTVPDKHKSYHTDIQFHIPTRLVSPSFRSRHLQVYYEILFKIQWIGHPTGLLKSTSTSQADFRVPIGITNLPHHHLLHIPHLTSIQHYSQSKEAPLFFDPSLDEPPSFSGPLTASTPLMSPPNYFMLSHGPSQWGQKERVERVLQTSELIRPGMAPELGDPIQIVSSQKDYEW